MLLTGVFFSIGTDLDITRVSDDTWRVDWFIPEPSGWPSSPGLFSLGLILVVLGGVLLGLYFWDPGPGRSLTLVEYPLFTWAAWIFGILAFLSLWAFDGHVAAFGGDGFSWRFLATPRSEVLDRVLTVVALVAWIASWLASWSLIPGRYAYADRVQSA